MNVMQEHKLLEALGQDSKTAFAALYREYAGKCLSFVGSLVKDNVAAKDIVHDIFVKVWLHRNVISKVDSFSSYLYRMSRNAVMDKFASDAIKMKYADSQIRSQSISEFCTDEKVDADEMHMLILNAVSKMPEQRRRVFTLSRYKGLTNAEIAESSGISIRTVENHITNALADIRKVLAENI